MEYTIHPIAHIRTDFTDKFGIPRQSGLVPELTARIVFEPEYRDPNALVGIEGYDRLWLIWQFSTVAAEYAAGKSWRPTVRPPRLGGNERRGVFATRSPYRPNALGLSCVELAGVENGELIVRGADLLDGTPIFDIKPYLPYVDAYPDARGGFTDTTKEYALQVVCPDALLCKVPENKRAALSGVLKNDPRPAYQHDPERVYTLDFGGNKVKFTVDGDILKVVDILSTGRKGGAAKPSAESLLAQRGGGRVYEAGGALQTSPATRLSFKKIPQSGTLYNKPYPKTP